MKPRHAIPGSVPRRSGVAVMVTAGLIFSGAASVYGFVFALGDVTGSFDSTFSVGVLDRLQDPNPNLYGTSNTFNGVPGRQNSVNSDDGNLNYPAGVSSLLFKGTHDLELKWRNYGAFVRGYYFYDSKNEGSDRPHTPLSKLAKERVGSDAVLLDNYVAGKFEIASMPLTVRAGRQVLSWGESTFIPNGINVINPIDVARLRVPGAELREALLPVYALDASLGLTGNLSLEAVWLAEFRRTEIDPDGTYFSTNDFASRGGSNVFLGFGSLPDSGTLGALPRGKDREGGNYGQWGVALRYLAPSLNDTEFGLYYIHYSSRLPLISAITPTTPVAPFVPGALAQLLIQNGAATSATAPTIAGQLLTISVTNPALLSAQQRALVAGAQQLGFLSAAATGNYFVEYPEGIDLLGASFNADLGKTGVSLQGEISLKNHVPLQVDDVELLFAALSSLNPAFGANNQIGNYLGQMGREISGYRRTNVWQAQITATKVFGPMLGASQLTTLAEVGATWVPNLPGKDSLRFDGSGTFTAGSDSEMINTGNGAYPATPLTAFPGRTSWGYQVVAKLDYNNLFAGINVSPSIAFAQDVHGNTPLPLGNFLEGRKTLTIGADFALQNKWGFELRYVNYFGGGVYNLLSDRDYVSATLKYSF